MESSSGDSPGGCYGGGDIAGAVIGSLIGGIVLAYLLYRLYMHYWRNRKDNNLVNEDPENAKQEFAFDNPAFRNEKQKAAANSPLDTKWTFNKKTPEKRLTADDANAAIPVTRSVALCGSDFTGLGIEICGGRKDGIYVKKVMPQGPAATIVRAGDKIVSITIDLQHMVQEDAATILSYASPYNVQLELVDGNGTLPRLSASPAHSRPASSAAVVVNSAPAAQTHPLHQASSPDDIDTIERHNKRQLFPQQPQQQLQPSHDEISNYPTLKLEAPASSSTAHPVPDTANRQLASTTTVTTVHRENEKLQQHAVPSPSVEIEHAQDAVSSSTNQCEESSNSMHASFEVPPPPPQQDDDQTTPSAPPPVVNKRTKHLKHTEIAVADATATADAPSHSEQLHHLQRSGSITSSGIRRDAAGIPQEIPDQMFAAAMAARGNRKSTANQIEEASAAAVAAAAEVVDEEKNRTANKKAPRPPARGDSLAEGSRHSMSAAVADAVASDVTTIDIDGVSDAIVGEMVPIEVAVNRRSNAEKAKPAMEDNNEPTINSELASGTINIELNANHITVHHSSELETAAHTPAPAAALSHDGPVPNKRHHHNHQHETHTDDDESPAAAPLAAEPERAAELPSPRPRSSIISLDSSLVEQVLAVADGFSMETRATLSRQLSELNEEHIPAVAHVQPTVRPLVYTDMEMGTQEEILNNYKFKAEPVLLSSMSSMMSQYQFEDRQLSGPPSASAAVAATIAVADSDLTDSISVEQAQDDDTKISYGLNIPDDVKVSQSSTSSSVAAAATATLSPSTAAVFSSDGHGVNSISITSMDISADELEHIVSSQPSSIIAIDDEDLDFTVHRSPAPLLLLTNGNRTPSMASVTTTAPPPAATTNGSNDVFIIESLSSMKTPPMAAEDEDELNHNHHNNSHFTSNYVTEIQLAPARPAAAASPPAVAPAQRNGNKPPASPPRAKQQLQQPQQRSVATAAPVDRIPRNTEMRFSTATYEERPPRISAVAVDHSNGSNGSKRQSPVEHYRTTFERGHTQSEIPVLVRRPSIPASPPAFSGGAHSQSTSSLSSLPRTSPSKIPVFNSPSGGGSSSKSGYSSSGSERAASVGSGGGSNGHSPPVQARTNGNGYLYRSHSSLNASAAQRASAGASPAQTGVVTVSAIKYSSRNPSGK